MGKAVLILLQYFYNLSIVRNEIIVNLPTNHKIRDNEERIEGTPKFITVGDRERQRGRQIASYSACTAA
jgi:hypothetical protein